MKALVACVLCLTACGGAARSATMPTAETAEVLDEWNAYHLPAGGLHAAFPGVPREITISNGHDESQVDTIGFESVSDTVELVCIRTTIHSDRAEDDVTLDNMSKQMFDKVTRSTPVTLLGFRGRVLEGKSKRAKRPQNARVFVAGNSIITGVVTHKKPGFDAKDSKRFLDACRFEIPWRLYPWPAAGVVVSMPDYAIELDERALQLGEGMVGRSFYLGGEHTLLFSLAMSPIERDGSLSDEQLLEAGVDAMEDKDTRVVTRSPIEFRGARGVDLLLRTAEGHSLWRLIVTPTRLYQIGVYATVREALMKAEARRFLESLRWNGDE